jgi:Ca2+-dependent lipid-binding protein
MENQTYLLKLKLIKNSEKQKQSKKQVNPTTKSNTSTDFPIWDEMFTLPFDSFDQTCQIALYGFLSFF